VNCTVIVQNVTQTCNCTECENEREECEDEYREIVRILRDTESKWWKWAAIGEAAALTVLAVGLVVCCCIHLNPAPPPPVPLLLSQQQEVEVELVEVTALMYSEQPETGTHYHASGLPNKQGDDDDDNDNDIAWVGTVRLFVTVTTMINAVLLLGLNNTAVAAYLGMEWFFQMLFYGPAAGVLIGLVLIALLNWRSLAVGIAVVEVLLGLASGAALAVGAGMLISQLKTGAIVWGSVHGRAVLAVLIAAFVGALAHLGVIAVAAVLWWRNTRK